MLASSRAPPSLALCRLGRGGLQHLGSLPLAPPEGVPNGSTVRLRGLSMQLVEAQPADGSMGDSRQLLAWVLLSVVQQGAAAPFLSAALSSRIYGSSRQQLWLACYPLPVETAVAAPAAAPSIRGAAAAYSAHAGAAGSAIASSVASARRHQGAAVAPESPRAEAVARAARVPPLAFPAAAAAGAVADAAATAAASSPAGSPAGSPANSPAGSPASSSADPVPAAAPRQVAALPQQASAIEAVLALQQAVDDMRQEVSARLDRLSAGLQQLLRTLQSDGAGDAAPAGRAEPATAAARAEPAP